MFRYVAVAGCVWLAGTVGVRAQLDPKSRHLIQVGYNQPLQGNSPIAGYAYYYMNNPAFAGTNYSLRLALAPVYLDSEFGIKQLLGPNTDLALGLAGGGFAESYYEIDQGKFEKKESFTGHGGGPSTSLYHLFNPGDRVPLYGLLRAETTYSTFVEDNNTADDFSLPDDFWTGIVRAGFRFGGREPLLFPELALELSIWYEGQYRSNPGTYGFNDDREINAFTHSFFTRGLIIYTLPNLQHTINLSLTLGTSIDADRLSAYRLGGVLPLGAEFPLSLPGYFRQEISAESFGLFSLLYSFPIDHKQRWSVVLQESTAVVEYVDGLSQPGNWHSGVGAGVLFRSPNGAWQVLLSYGYGIDAIRGDDRGAHSVGFLLQWDLDRAKVPIFDVGLNPNRSGWLDRIFRNWF